MTMDSPHCSCSGPLAGIPVGPCPVHGNEHTRERLERAEAEAATLREQLADAEAYIRLGVGQREGLAKGFDGVVEDARRVRAERDRLKGELDRAREALYTAYGFIGAVTRWDGQPDDREEALAEVQAALAALAPSEERGDGKIESSDHHSEGSSPGHREAPEGGRNLGAEGSSFARSRGDATEQSEVSAEGPREAREFTLARVVIGRSVCGWPVVEHPDGWRVVGHSSELEATREAYGGKIESVTVREVRGGDQGQEA